MSNKPGVTLVHSIGTRNVSLRLEALQEGDSGTYRCSVNVLDDKGTSMGHGIKSIELKVLGEYADDDGHISGSFPTPAQGGEAGLPLKWPSIRPGRERWDD